MDRQTGNEASGSKTKTAYYSKSSGQNIAREFPTPQSRQGYKMAPAQAVGCITGEDPPNQEIVVL